MTVANPKYQDLRWSADDNRWEDAKRIIGNQRVTLGPQASQQWLDAPDHLAMVLARYRAARALTGCARHIVEIGCGEGIGASILGNGRAYLGVDTDAEAIAIAREHHSRRPWMTFTHLNALAMDGEHAFDAVVALDVIEHIPTEREHEFMRACTAPLSDHGVCVIGTPSKHAEHLASPQSRAGHVNLYTSDRLKALMGRYFHVVQMLYMQDTAVHFGHPEMAHYIMAVGIGPKRG